MLPLGIVDDINEFQYASEPEASCSMMMMMMMDPIARFTNGKRNNDELGTIMCDLDGIPHFLPPRLPAASYQYPQLSRNLNSSFYLQLQRLESELARGNRQSRISHPQSASPSPVEVSNQLWVEKYRPRRFTDLIAVEAEHMEVLQWTTGWRRKICRDDDAEESTKKRFKSESPNSMENLNFEKSILLLHGSPGLGKTTLAHLMAKIGGFNPVEINASDERSGEGVVNKILAALRADSISGLAKNESLPNMLIIDEIDGAASGTGGNQDRSLITLLTRLALSTTTKSKSTIDESEGQEVSKKAKAPTITLNRPIICICNDLYAPTLRSLRSVVKIIKLPKPSSTSLARRLCEIGQAEGIKIDGKATLELAEIAGCDVRAALQILQFLATKTKGNVISSSQLREELPGLKDVRCSTLTLYDRLFTYAKNERTMLKDRHTCHIGEAGLLETLISHEEFDRIAAGAFELYPHCKYYDDTHQSKARTALDWLIFLDQCQTSWEDRTTAYSPYALLKLNRLFGSPVRQTSTISARFPREDHRNYQLAEQLREIAQSYQKDLESIHRGPLRTRMLIMERIPAMIKTIDRTNPQLLKPEEKQCLKQIVNTMLGEGLTFRPVKGQDGIYDYLLEPPIDRLVRFELNIDGPPEPSTTHTFKAHTNGVRQMLANEIASEKIRMSQKKNHVTISSTTTETSQSKRSLELMDAYKGMKTVFSGNSTKHQTQAPGKRDFFGRPIKEPMVLVQECNPKQNSTRIWYKYNEGYTNAIRKPIRISRLFS